MRRSPAFFSIQALIENDSFLGYPAELKETQDNKRYFFVPIKLQRDQFVLGGNTYETTGQPHLSVFEFFKLNESRGLSVYHVTIEFPSIRLHLYFDRLGQYLYYQSPDITLTDDELQSILPQVEPVLLPLMQSLSQYIIDRYNESSEAVNAVFKEMEDLSATLATKRKEYLGAAEKVIQRIEEKNKWNFLRDDPRVRFPKVVIENFTVSEETPVLFSQPKAVAVIPKETPKASVPKASVKKPTTQLTKVEDTVEQALSRIKKEENLLPAEKKIRILSLLESKVADALKTGSANEILKILSEIKKTKQSIASQVTEACQKGDIETIKLLQDYIDCFSYRDLSRVLNEGHTALFIYLVKQFDENFFYITRMLFYLPHQKGSQVSFLFDALNKNNIEAFKFMLHCGASPDVGIQYQYNLLQTAIIYDALEFVQAIFDFRFHQTKVSAGSIKKIEDKVLEKFAFKMEKLISRPVSKDVPENPLHLAVSLGRLEIARFLLDVGYCVNEKAKNQAENALGFACNGWGVGNNTSFELIQLLLDRGADINSSQGIREDNTAPTLIVANDQKNQLTNTPFSLNRDRLPEWANNTFSTVLHHACQFGKLDLVKFLVKQSANVDQPDIKAHTAWDTQKKAVLGCYYATETPMQCAVIFNHFDVFRYLARNANYSAENMLMALADFFFFSFSKKGEELSFGFMELDNTIKPAFTPERHALDSDKLRALSEEVTILMNCISIWKITGGNSQKRQASIQRLRQEEIINDENEAAFLAKLESNKDFSYEALFEKAKTFYRDGHYYQACRYFASSMLSISFKMFPTEKQCLLAVFYMGCCFEKMELRNRAYQCFRGLEEYRRLGKPTFNGESINPWILAPLKRQELQRASAKAKAAAKPKPNPKPGVKKEAPRKMQP